MAAAHLKQPQITTSSLISWYYFLQETKHIPSQDKKHKQGGVSEHPEILHCEGDPELGCPERLWSLCFKRYSKTLWTGCWAAGWGWLLEQRRRTMCQTALPTPTMQEQSEAEHSQFAVLLDGKGSGLRRNTAFTPKPFPHTQ